MRRLEPTTQFRRDLKRLRKRGLEPGDAIAVADRLAAGERLPAEYHDHGLAGEFRGSRECHIRPDWLLIYQLTEEAVILVRTGTHQDLFGG